MGEYHNVAHSTCCDLHFKSQHTLVCPIFEMSSFNCSVMTNGCRITNLILALPSAACLSVFLENTSCISIVQCYPRVSIPPTPPYLLYIICHNIRQPPIKILLTSVQLIPIPNAMVQIRIRSDPYMWLSFCLQSFSQMHRR